MPKCPYCEKEAKERGLKNHVRLSSGDGHGERGEIPEDYEGGISDGDGDSDIPDSPDSDDGDDGDSGPSEASEAAEVTADDLTAPEPKEPDTDESEASDDGLPFDPNDDGAIRLDGDETLYVRTGGEVVQATPDDGDYLLMTDDGPVLWDNKTDDRYEVVTA